MNLIEPPGDSKGRLGGLFLFDIPVLIYGIFIEDFEAGPGFGVFYNMLFRTVPGYPGVFSV